MINSTDPIARVPTVKILLDGLLLLRFDTNEETSTECQVGVVSTAFDHELSVSIIETLPAPKYGSKAYIHNKRIFTLCPSTCRHLGSINLHVVSRSGRKQKVTRYGYGDGNPLQDRSADPDTQNFKWILDFTNGEFHDTKVAIARGVFSPVIRLNAGEFYTHATTEMEYDCVKADASKRYFGKMAQTIGVNIDLKDDEELVLQRPDGTTLWPLKRHPKATYLIRLQNVCPACKTPVDTDVIKAQSLMTSKNEKEFREKEKALMLKDEKKDERKEEKKDPKERYGRSDLQYYYDAFTGFSGIEHYDFPPLRPLIGAKPLVCYPVSGSYPAMDPIP
jgi:hypothetical protein